MWNPWRRWYVHRNILVITNQEERILDSTLPLVAILEKAGLEVQDLSHLCVCRHLCWQFNQHKTTTFQESCLGIYTSLESKQKSKCGSYTIGHKYMVPLPVGWLYILTKLNLGIYLDLVSEMWAEVMVVTSRKQFLRASAWLGKFSVILEAIDFCLPVTLNDYYEPSSFSDTWWNIVTDKFIYFKLLKLSFCLLLHLSLPYLIQKSKLFYLLVWMEHGDICS
jgi:hypothetical protein